ncbi:MAG: DNA-binding transcriptional LysR family regulator [Paracoccaceae bacterium]|jgi:DNA-binding transcriptional LysR family regulator
MRIMNLPMDLLRSFVTVIEVESYTQAANVLGRTQPAISLQIRRLEQLVGQRLIVQKGRAISLTETGEALAQHARQILRLNDLAIAQFDRTEDRANLRIGLPLDYAVDVLQARMTDLVKDHPEIQIEIQCALSQTLLEALQNDEIDVIVALFKGSDQQFLFRHWTEQPIWVGAQTFELPQTAAIPLVVHPADCAYRGRMTQALKQVNRRWRIAYSSPGIAGLQAAVLNGLGLSCLTVPTLRKGMRRFTAADGLPDLAPLHIGLFFRQSRLGSCGHEAVGVMVKAIEEALSTSQSHKKA